MSRLRRLVVSSALGLAMAAVAVPAAPASASVSGPAVAVDNLAFHWIPGTGNVRATAHATCSPEMKASFEVGVYQPKAGATASTALRCDGRSHRVVLMLDPRKGGRFQPGRSGASWSTMGCTKTECVASYADGFANVQRPGKARGPR